MLENKLSFKQKIHYMLSAGKGLAIQTDLNYINAFIIAVNKINYRDKSNEYLKQIFDDKDSGTEEFFACWKESFRRIKGIDLLETQLAAAYVMAGCSLAQLDTGEGKTFAASGAALYFARQNHSVHLFTANDYLAKRDREWLQDIYSFFNVPVSSISSLSGISERKAAYRAQVIYLTVKEAGFDFLRDELRTVGEAKIQNLPDTAIIDEADFILIDEAIIPMVIAQSSMNQLTNPHTAENIFSTLEKGTDYQTDQNGRNCFLTKQGLNKIYSLFSEMKLTTDDQDSLLAGINVCMHAHCLLRAGIDYIVADESIMLVDELTGRIAENRKWPYGIHTALEIKEGLEAGDEGVVKGRITIQNYLNQYHQRAAMTATAESSAAELKAVYGLKIVKIPPYKERHVIRTDDFLYRTKEEKYIAVIDMIKKVHSKGQPLLIGTLSISESESLAEMMRAEGLECNVLNAVNTKEEAEIISSAGTYGAITVSTNMAGRGTDIMLGGLSRDNYKKLCESGGLYVIGTSRNASRRIDDQLAGRAGRQGEPGRVSFFVSLEDELFKRFGIKEFLPARYLREDFKGLIQDNRVSREIKRAQHIIEEQHFSIRNTLSRYSSVTEKHRRTIADFRNSVLNGELTDLDLVPESIRTSIGQDRAFEQAVRAFILYEIDNFWADYLVQADKTLEGIYLQRIGGREPFLEYLRLM